MLIMLRFYQQKVKRHPFGKTIMSSRPPLENNSINEAHSVHSSVRSIDPLFHMQHTMKDMAEMKESRKAILIHSRRTCTIIACG